METPRILELRRRVQSDPASVVFAQLAEEYRRAGEYEAAVRCCHTGLARHPGYLSARVTLGCALIALGSIDAATRELELVLRTAPDNLAAIHGMAEIHQRRGNFDAALECYERTLTLARRSRKEGTNPSSDRLSAVPIRPVRATPERSPSATQAAPETPTSGSESLLHFEPEPLQDFDALLQVLGAPHAAPPPMIEMLLSEQGLTAFYSESALPEWSNDSRSGDPFEALERELRAFESMNGRTSAPPSGEAHAPSTSASGAPDQPRPRIRLGRQAVQSAVILADLEAWLAAIQDDRARRAASA